MRLLQTATGEIEEFIGQVPEYAILSHTWGEGEVSYQDLIGKAEAQKKGWSKIRDCCARAAKDGWKYVWIDTCCINKESSAELSESINSMFAWYEQAAVCYAYLSDVDGRSAGYNSQLNRSRWFKRGWTLQEFLAPPFLVFLDQNWQELGTRYSLRNIISPITKIQPQQMIDFRSCNVATKFSWAALRETTRPEDQAYCLMGLFGINMPLLYGEGSKAFIRLQRKIIASSNDESIFAWEGDPGSGPRPMTGGLLARSPYSFRNALNTRHLLFDETRPDFVKAKNGVGFSPMLYQHKDIKPHFLLPLNCAWDSENVPVGIRLKPLDSRHKVFVRVLRTPELAKIDPRAVSNVSNGWQQLERREIIIRDIEELEVQFTWMVPLVLTLEYPEHMHFIGFSTIFREGNFRSLIRTMIGPGRDFLKTLGYSHKSGGMDPFNSYTNTITPTLTADQACFRESEILTMRFQVDITRKIEPIELLVVVGLRNNDFAIIGWEWHGESHACTELESFANDYTAKSDCTVFVDCNEPIQIALRPAPSQHRWNIERPLKEVTVAITL